MVNITGPGGYVNSMTTGADGIYTFNNLLAGSYTVCVVAMSGYTQTYDLTGPLDGCATRVLGIGETTDIVDFGYRLVPVTTSIGDFVWYDLNKDGRQNNGEPGLAGSTVTLWQCGPDGLAGTADDVGPLMAQTTLASGAYLFSDLLPGCYYVTFSTPAGYTPTPPNAGGDDSVNSDAVAGVTRPYTLAPGVPNLTVDAGFYLAAPGLEIVKTVNKPVIAPYDPVTYSYTVTNTGGTTLTSINVTDNNGTPAFAGDDFTVCTIASLAPGASQTCAATVIPVVST